MIRISADDIVDSECLAEFRSQVPLAGAIVTFTGQVRADGAGARVVSLMLQSYPPLTETGIAGAVSEARAKWPLEGVYVVHRTGEMRPGDTIVFVAAASRHRRAAFEAADFLMDYLKTEAVFWKKETTETDTKWIEPRPEDYNDRSRWI